ncbi:hypothetical protein D3C81_2191560 [compost metagenome]
MANCGPSKWSLRSFISGMPVKLSRPKNFGPAAAMKGAWAMQATLETYCRVLTSGALGPKK